MFELHKVDEEHYVRIIYRTEDIQNECTVTKTTLLCECSLKDFIKNNEDVLPTESVSTECSRKNKNLSKLVVFDD